MANPISDYVVSLLRTAVPGLWGTLIAFLLTAFGWLASVFEFLGVDPTSPQAASWATGVAIALWYALWRWLEPKLPAWLTRLVLGSNQAPTYTGRHVAEER